VRTVGGGADGDPRGRAVAAVSRLREGDELRLLATGLHDGDGDFQQLEDPISEDHSSSDDFAS
jgi:hypothetical protein